MSLRKAVALGAIVAVMLLTAAPALAQYPPTPGGLTGSTGTVKPGGTLTISGGGFKPGSTVTIRIDGVVIATVTADESGRISVTVKVPPGTKPGAHTLTATGITPSGTPNVLGLSLAITGVGADVGGIPIGLIALGLILVGGGALAVAARKSRVHA